MFALGFASGMRIFHSFEDVIIVCKGLQNQTMLGAHDHCAVRIFYHVHATVTWDLIGKFAIFTLTPNNALIKADTASNTKNIAALGSNMVASLNGCELSVPLLGHHDCSTLMESSTYKTIKLSSELIRRASMSTLSIYIANLRTYLGISKF